MGIENYLASTGFANLAFEDVVMYFVGAIFIYLAITKDYEPRRFGGFIGDCADDKNWPHYWECMSENSGNGFK